MVPRDDLSLLRYVRVEREINGGVPEADRLELTLLERVSGSLEMASPSNRISNIKRACKKKSIVTGIDIGNERERERERENQAKLIHNHMQNNVKKQDR